ncbi:DUF4176 domain-containing protein [Bifidobacterium sp. LC6]|uniref:DUF4176 domain-containing protein n=1 Tax=Bifidobacterium colobi TaxID=2809026 RepID=A0ABS5UU48_9BIFI|nr:DUF4176 domain-containing protein [Bifidobacterium colobi]MBT1174505.1 DUF4176 domain-containing protein [Bifidobacterium colobi]
MVDASAAGKNDSADGVENVGVLPLGSVVRLRDGGDALLLVVSRAALTERDGHRGYFDYAAVVYPQGLVDSRRVLFFNREDVADVVFVGFVDDVERGFEQRYDDLVAAGGYERFSVDVGARS